MARCSNCGTTILFGGIKDGTRRFCKQQCYQSGRGLAICDSLPQDLVDEQLLEIHGGLCPICKGPGPIDVYYGHTIWSVIVLTSFSTERRISCRHCGAKHQRMCFVESLFAGWWGFPVGLVMTPVQLVRNVRAMLNRPDPNLPSPDLEKLVRLHIGNTISQSQAHQVPTAPPTSRI